MSVSGVNGVNGASVSGVRGVVCVCCTCIHLCDVCACVCGYRIRGRKIELKRKADIFGTEQSSDATYNFPRPESIQWQVEKERSELSSTLHSALEVAASPTTSLVCRKA